MNHLLNVAGITPMSTVDYPDLLSAVIYMQGCPLRCGYCHNPHLISTKKSTDCLEWNSVIDFLQQRKGFLQAIVFSGGEPTLQTDLPKAIVQVKQMNFKIGLHTAGVYPKKIAMLLDDLDWIGLDIKSLPENYTKVVGRADMSKRVDESLALITASSIEHEIRITLHPLDIDLKGVSHLLDRIGSFGVKNCVIQLARGGQTLDPTYRVIDNSFNTNEIHLLIQSKSGIFEKLFLRSS